MIPLHQMPAANPERMETQVKTIQVKCEIVKTIQVKTINKLDPAMPVHTHTPSRVVPRGPRVQHEPLVDSLTAFPACR